jgi:predicted MPP superfamily phosphohydrolase
VGDPARGREARSFMGTRAATYTFQVGTNGAFRSAANGRPGTRAATATSPPIHRRRELAPPRFITGNERRWINPNRGLIKLVERNLDVVVSRFLYPHLSRIWNPYSWLLERRFVVSEASISPAGWPIGLDPLRVLLLSDIHTGIFLRPESLAETVTSLMALAPDLVVIAGDIVTGHVSEVRPYLDGLSPLSRAPLGAWYSHGNHDYFGGDPEWIRKDLSSAGITTLVNESVEISHGRGRFVLGALDDLILGRPDWRGVLSPYGAPHLLVAHNPDHFHEAESYRIPLTLSGHTHGGQIRLPGGPPIIRHSRFCLDEGMFALRSSMLVVSRGLGSVGLPWRWGADPEAVLLEVVSRAESSRRPERTEAQVDDVLVGDRR